MKQYYDQGMLGLNRGLLWKEEDLSQIRIGWSSIVTKLGHVRLGFDGTVE